jgi:hypothetical protein
MKYNFDYVNFTNTIIPNNKSIINNSEDYDEITNEQYRILRLYKYDPITNEEIPKNLIFEFKEKWNPFIGERLEFDDNGPLCFNAWNLYHYYYSNRFKGLWYPPQEQYQGYYGDLLGSGKNIIINNKPCPEKYLYRLPIIDCYLKKSHNHSVITFAPILTNDEINQIDALITNLRKNKPKLILLKQYYDEAINPSPDVSELKKSKPSLSDKELAELYNKSFVDKLINM